MNYKNGINIGPFAEETIKVMKEKLGEPSEIYCDDIADYTISEIVKIKHNYGLIKKESNNYNVPILLMPHYIKYLIGEISDIKAVNYRLLATINNLHSEISSIKREINKNETCIPMDLENGNKKK